MTRNVRAIGGVILAVLVCAAWGWWLASSHLSHGPESYYRQHDTAEVHGAYYLGQGAFAERGLVGDWTPIGGAGVDARANGKGVQPLFESIFRIAPYWWTTGAVVLFQTFAAAFFTALLLRRVGVSLIPGLLAGLAASIVFDGKGAFSGFFLPAGMYVPLFPLCVLVLMRAGECRMPVAAAIAALTAIVVGVSAGPILVLLSLPLVAIWVFGVERGTRRHALALAVYVAGIIVMAAPMFAALSAYAGDAHRTLWPTITHGADDAARWTQRREEAALLIEIMKPMLWPAFLGLIAGGFRRRALVVTSAVSAGVILLVASMVTVRGWIQAVAPSLATFQVDRVAQFLPFLTAAAGALGLQQGLVIAARFPRRWMRLLALLPIVIGMGMIARELVDRGQAINTHREELRRRSSSFAGMLAQPEIAALAAHMRAQPLARVATFADRNEAFGGQHPGFAWAHGLETADGYLNLYPVRYHTFWSWLIEPALTRSADLQDYFDTWGNMFYLFDPYYVRPSPVPLSNVVHPNLLSLLNVRYVISPVALADPSLTRWPGTPGTPTGEAQWRTSESGAALRSVFVYENRDWLPRVFVATRVEAFDGVDALLGAMRTATAGDLKTVAFLERSYAAQRPHASGGARAGATLVEYTADRLTVDVDAPQGGMLVVTNGYSRFWRAFVDDRPEPVVPADLAFQGVRLTPGAKRVRLEYAPPYAYPWWACALGVVAVTAIAIAAAAGARRLPRVPLLPALAIGAAVLVVLAIVRVGANREVSAPWTDASAPARAQVVLRPRALSTPVDVPLLIERGPDQAAFWDRVPRGATAVTFTDARGRLLEFETEQFDVASRQLAAWVKTPAFGWGDRIIYMYFHDAPSGGPAAPGGAAGNVWSSGFAGVWHMNDPAGSRAARDSSGRGHDGSLAAGMAQGWRVPGRIGGAAWFGGSDVITIADSDDWSFGAGDWAVEAWLKPEPQERRNYGIVEHGPGNFFQLYLHGGNMFVLERKNGSIINDQSFAEVGLEPRVWQHVALARTGQRLTLHVNGTLKTTVEGPPFADADPAAALTLGAGTYGGWHGAIDEVRISRGPRPPGWSRASYFSQTGAMVSVGSVELRPAGGGTR